MIIFLYVAPPAIVQVTNRDNVALNESVTLECIATVVRGVTSNLNFQWFLTGSRVFRRTVRIATNVTGNVSNTSITFRDFLAVPTLNTFNRGDIYTCEVEISNSSINFSNTSAGSFELDFPSKIFM